MFEVGLFEIVLILGLALLVLGPEKLPGLAAKIGRWTGRARSMARQLRTQLEQEVTLDELAKTRAAETPATSTAAGVAATAANTAAADAFADSNLDAEVSHDHGQAIDSDTAIHDHPENHHETADASVSALDPATTKTEQ